LSNMAAVSNMAAGGSSGTGSLNNLDGIVITGYPKYLESLTGKMNKRPGKSRSSVSQNPNAFRSNEKAPEGPPVELENQFIMRLPDSEAATALRKAIESGASNLKERLFIQLEPDKMSNNQYLRKGRVQFDGWNFTSRLVDLPTIIESHKTIDAKTMYKTADISQLMVCKEGDEFEKEEAVSPSKKKRDPNKVDKKFLCPHGIAPPLKNCRKRRFRKTLKKKYVEAPEIEKEVKRLLRTDNESITVNWEVITENELNANKGGEAGKDNPDVHPSQSGVFTNDPKDLGLDLSDSEDETRDIDIDSEDNSRLSAGDDSRTFDSHMADKRSSPSTAAPLQFSKEMFQQPAIPPPHILNQRSAEEQELKAELIMLKSRLKELEHNISTCPNISLKEKFKMEVREIKQQIKDKEG